MDVDTWIGVYYNLGCVKCLSCMGCIELCEPTLSRASCIELYVLLLVAVGLILSCCFDTVALG